MRKPLLALFLALFLTLGLAACGSTPAPEANNTASDSAPSESIPQTESNGGVLVAYFSATGNTEGSAQHLQAVLGADLYEIIPAKPYSDDDLDYNASDCRANQEQNDPSVRPAIDGSVENMDSYDVILLGYPIWWGEAPRIISTFLESYDFTGKTLLHQRLQRHRWERGTSDGFGCGCYLAGGRPLQPWCYPGRSCRLGGGPGSMRGGTFCEEEYRQKFVLVPHPAGGGGRYGRRQAKLDPSGSSGDHRP